jgi:glycosyltransferase involved in cell wall biosynthesis
MTCLFDTRWIDGHGIGRFANEVHRRLQTVELKVEGRPMSPLDTLRLSWAMLFARRDDWLLSPGYNAPLITHLPYVFAIHDLNHIDRNDNSSVVKRLYYRLVLRRLCRRARAVLTVSEFSKQRIVDWFGLDAARVFNVGNGVSESFRPDGPRHVVYGGYVLCVSNRRGHKNEEGLLQAFARAPLPADLKLVLTGEASEGLNELARSLGIGDRLVFSGKVSEADLGALYRGAVFLVFPSFYEGFGLPIVEAFACGTPVITSNVTSMPEIAGDAALLVNPHDVDEIAQAMVRLHGSTELRSSLVARGHRRVAAFSWDAVARRIQAAVQAVDTDPQHPLNWN